MKTFVLMLITLAALAAGCVSINEDTAKAYVLQTDSVVEEWNEMVPNAYRKTDDGQFVPWFLDDSTGTREEKLERRERKYKSANILADELAKEIGHTRAKDQP